MRLPRIHARVRVHTPANVRALGEAADAEVYA